jgi:amino acid transporter
MPLAGERSRGASDSGSLGVAACTALVVGNMVGSGFYLSPSALAGYGQLAILGWIVMGFGASCLGLVFARLARMDPVTGGPYAYTRMAYGDFAGFAVAWGYWISIWASLPAIAAGFAGYVRALAPTLVSTRLAYLALMLGAMWTVAAVNLRGVGTAGAFQSVTTYTKILPFLLLSVVGLFFLHPGYLAEFNPSGLSTFAASAAVAPLTMFAYLGLESATVPAGNVRDPERTIPRATMLGIGISGLVYVLGTVVVMGVVPRDRLARSAAPFSDAAAAMFGPWAGVVIALAAVVSCLGALNGWSLLMGQVPMAAAKDQLFPAVFGRLSARGVPAVGILVSTSLATILVLAQASGTKGLVQFYELIVNLSTMAAVIPYAFCSLAGVLIAMRNAQARGHPVHVRVKPIEIVAFAFALFTVYGCGPEAVLYGAMLFLVAIPVYIWLRSHKAAADAAAGVSLGEAKW